MLRADLRRLMGVSTADDEKQVSSKLFVLGLVSRLIGRLADGADCCGA